MAFDSILLILVPEDNPGFGAPADGAGGLVHPVTSDALDFVPVKSKNRSSHSTSRVGSGSGRQRRDHPGLKPTQARWSRTSRAGPGPGRGRSSRLFWDSRRLSCPQSNQSYFAPRGDNSSRPLLPQPEVISTNDQGVGTGPRWPNMK